jgi:hypothetical protein
MLQPWLLLLLSLPPRPSSLRVRAWRRLRALGAVALKSGAYLLPFSPDRYEQFQWLAQEVQKDRGEATLLKVDRVENMKQPEVVRLFHEARNADYAALTDRYRKLGSAKGSRAAEELARLAREMDRLADIDFFEAPGRQQALRAREATSGAIKALLQLAPKTARRIGTDGTDHEVEIDSLAVGERLRVRPGEKVPVDGVILEGRSSLDESLVTGESMPVTREVGGKVIAGTLNRSGGFVMRADKVGRDTLLARIVQMEVTGVVGGEGGLIVVMALRSHHPILGPRMSATRVELLVLRLGRRVQRLRVVRRVDHPQQRHCGAEPRRHRATGKRRRRAGRSRRCHGSPSTALRWSIPLLASEAANRCGP